MKLLPTCREVSRMVSEGLDRQLGPIDRVRVTTPSGRVSEPLPLGERPEIAALHPHLAHVRGFAAQFETDWADEGEIGVLSGHEPVLGVLAAGGVVRIDTETEGKITAAVHGGFLSVDKDVVTILAEVAELAGEIDVARAQAALERARNEESEHATEAAHRAEARLRAVAGLHP